MCCGVGQFRILSHVGTWPAVYRGKPPLVPTSRSQLIRHRHRQAPGNRDGLRAQLGVVDRREPESDKPVRARVSTGNDGCGMSVVYRGKHPPQGHYLCHWRCSSGDASATPMCRFTAVNADRERTPCRSLPSRDHHTIRLSSATALQARASLAACFLVYRGKQEPVPTRHSPRGRGVYRGKQGERYSLIS